MLEGGKKFNANNSNNARNSNTKVNEPDMPGVDNSSTELRTNHHNLTATTDAPAFQEAEPGATCSPIILSSDDAFSKFWRSVTSQQFENTTSQGQTELGQSRLSGYLKWNTCASSSTATESHPLLESTTNRVRSMKACFIAHHFIITNI